MKAPAVVISILCVLTFAHSGVFDICEVVGDQIDPSIAFDGTNYLVVWQDYRSGNWDIYGARVTRQGEVLDPQGIPIAVTPEAEREPAIAFDGTNYLVVWRYTQGGTSDIYGTRVSPLGTVLDPSGLVITDWYRNQFRPAIAFDGTNYLVVWTDDRQWLAHWTDIYGVRISQAGLRLDNQDILIHLFYESQVHPAVAYGSNYYLVAWTEITETEGPQDIYGSRVDQDGVVLDPYGIVISDAPADQQRPAIAFDGTNYLVVWGDWRGPQRDIYGSRVDEYGTVLDPDGLIISNAVNHQDCPVVVYDGTSYMVVWEDKRYDNCYDIFGTRVDQSGVTIDSLGIEVLVEADSQMFPAVSTDNADYLVIWQDFRNGDWDIRANLLSLGVSDPLALAYNGNRHLVRRPNSDQLHLVYGNEGKVQYTRSTDGGNDWSWPVAVGEGKYPAIFLNYENVPVLTWTDDEGGLWYAEQSALGNWDVYHLYDPIHGTDPLLVSPPAITVTSSLQGDTVHILAALEREIPLLAGVAEYAFPIQDPSQGGFVYIEGGPQSPPKHCTSPSIAKDYEKRIHATWQRSDTICYATRGVDQAWVNWGWQFRENGLESAHPFVETYGDSVFVVWQREVDEEVYRGARHLSYPFDGENLSLTPRKVSLYPVNASGLATTFVDETELVPIDGPYEIYWKTKPDDDLHNISQSPRINSIFPQTNLRFNQIADNQLYVIWQEGNTSPYEIKFKQVFVPGRASAFFSSSNGNSEPSPYLVARDTFFDNWTIPVDVGDESIAYRFPLEPGYLYKAKTIAYHESSGEWQARIKIDNAAEFLVRYNAHMPETLEIWIPPILYQDSIVEVSFNKVTGDFAAAGPLYIYRYEEEGRGGSPGGPMAQDRGSLSRTEFLVTPTLITERANILLQMYTDDRTTVKIYDASGRLVKNVFEGTARGKHVLQWDGGDEVGRAVPVGVYFVQVRNRHTGATICEKVLKVR